MSLQILVDEDSQAKLLVKKLRDTGYDVKTVAEAGLNGRADSIIFEYAKSSRRVLLTQNCADFLELHKADPDHHGILLVYKNSSPEKDMSVTQIVCIFSRKMATKSHRIWPVIIIENGHPLSFNLVGDSHRKWPLANLLG